MLQHDSCRPPLVLTSGGWYLLSPFTQPAGLVNQVSLVQLSAVITRSNIVRYYINDYRNWGRISIRWWMYKRQPIPRSYGRAMGCLLLIFLRKCYNGSALWCHMVCYIWFSNGSGNGLSPIWPGTKTSSEPMLTYLYPPYPKDRGMLWFYVEAARRPPPATRRPPPAMVLTR